MSRSITNIKYIDALELYQWLKQGVNSLGQPFRVIDVRGSDYVGGHIKGCLNFPYKRLSTDETYITELIDELNHVYENSDTEKVNVVFHCAQSQQRGPSAAMKFIRTLSDEDILKYNIWMLRGGFNHWQDLYGDDDTVTEDYKPDLWSW